MKGIVVLRNRFLTVLSCILLIYGISGCTALLDDINGLQNYTYTVTFMYDSETMWSKEYVVSPETTLTVLPKEPTKTNCYFKGWYTKVSEGDQVTSLSTVSKNMTVYAQWLTVVAPITNGTESDDGGTVKFTAQTDTSSLNDTDVLGLVAKSVSSSATSVATAIIKDGSIAITSIAKGTTTITCTDDSNNVASIAVTVVADGSMTLVVTKYTTGNASYKVLYFIQNTDGSYSETATEQATLSGKVGSVATYTAKTETGYELNAEKTGDVSAVNIGADGSTVVKIYYARKMVTITLDPNGGSFDENPTTVSGLYGAPIVLPTVPSYDGHSFSDWSPKIPTVFPESSFTSKAQWIVVAEIFTTHTNMNTANIIGTLGLVATTVTSSNTAIATVELKEGNVAITSMAKGTATVTCTDASSHIATISITVSGDGNITLNVIKYVENNVNYKVAYFMMKIDGTYSDTADESATLSGVIGSAAIYTAKTTVGFILDTEKTVATTIAADGSTVAKVYYARKTITITLNAAGGVCDKVSLSGLYGAAVVAPVNPTLSGYSFTAWTPSIPTTFPDSDMTCKATWTVIGTTFIAQTDISTENTTAILGVVATTVNSSDTKIATVEITGTNIAVTSVAKGSATITCIDASAHEAKIHVTVSATGGITIDTITKYGSSIYTAPVDETKSTPSADIHGYKIGVAWATWCPSHFETTAFNSFMSKVDEYGINRVTVIPSYFLNNYTEGVISKNFDLYTPSLADQENVILTLINKGVTINFRPHIDPAQFNSTLSASVVAGTPGKQDWRGKFDKLDPLSDDYKQVILNSIEVLRVVLNSSKRTMNLREKIRFDLGAELMDSIKNYPDHWVELVAWTREQLDKDENKIVKDNVLLSYNFCHHIYYKMSIDNHKDWFQRILGPSDSYDDNVDLLYVDKMDAAHRANLATFIKNLDVFTTSQYMPLDVTSTAKADTSKDKCGFPDIDDISETDVKNALILHQNTLFNDIFGASLADGGLGITGDDLKAVKAKYHFGEYGMGIKGLYAPNVWDTTAYDMDSYTNCLNYERQKKHAEKAIAGLINYIESDDALAQSLTIWMSGAPYDILDLFPSMSVGDSGHGYSGKDAFNVNASTFLKNYWAAGTIPSSPATGDDSDQKKVTTKVIEGFESGTGKWTLPNWENEKATAAVVATNWKTEGAQSVQISFDAAGDSEKKATYYNENLSTTDYSDYKNLTFDVKNTDTSAVKVCIAITANNWTWYESEQQTIDASSEKSAVTFDITASAYRVTDDGAYTNKISGLGNVQRIAVRLYLPANTPAGSVYVDDIKLVPETAE